MKRDFYYDLYRYEGEKAKSWFVKYKDVLFSPSIQYVYLFRKTQNSRFVVFRFLWMVILRMCQYQFGIQIPYQTSIDKGFRILHYGTIVVNPNTKIGKNFNIAEGCLIGGALGKHSGFPVIGDNVVMGANSIILGGVIIGNDVLIAPGAFVNFDVPSNSVVIGNPGEIFQKESSPTEKYEIYRI